MPHLFEIVVEVPPTEPVTKVVRVVAETAEDAQAKVGVQEGEVVTAVNDQGEVTL